MKANSRNKILMAARESFYRSGYLATSVDALLQQAGVSKSNFYYHFRSKEDLGVAVLLTRWTEFEHTLEGTLRRRDAEPRERLRAFLDDLVQAQAHLVGHGGCPFGNLVAEMADQSDKFRCLLSELFARLSSEIAQVLAEGQAAGQFRSDIDAQSASRLLVHVTQGVHTMAKCDGSAIVPGETSRLLIGLLADPRASAGNEVQTALPGKVPL